jgi:plastocyanin
MQEMQTMKARFLLGLVVGSLGLLTLVPSQAQAQWRGYYGGYSYPALTSYYYPTYYTPMSSYSAYYYPAPVSYYYPPVTTSYYYRATTGYYSYYPPMTRYYSYYPATPSYSSYYAPPCRMLYSSPPSSTYAGAYAPPQSYGPSGAYGKEQPGAGSTVGVYDNYFEPATITVAPGTTVRWTNHGQHRHTVTSDTKLFDSGELGPGESYSYTFKDPGTYRYSCRIHPKDMRGTVTVR